MASYADQYKNLHDDPKIHRRAANTNRSKVEDLGIKISGIPHFVPYVNSSPNLLKT